MIYETAFLETCIVASARDWISFGADVIGQDELEIFDKLPRGGMSYRRSV
jgi:hypothetical protein